ncbi:MAG: hypothetical protein ACR2NA_03210 [Solirubrobacterales bacterium]
MTEDPGAGSREREPELQPGEVEVGRRAVLPGGAEPPYAVYINGIEQTEGADYTVRDRQIVFARPIVKERQLGGIRWLSMLLGLAGTYRRNETVDVQYHRGGSVELASDVEIVE